MRFTPDCFFIALFASPVSGEVSAQRTEGEGYKRGVTPPPSSYDDDTSPETGRKEE
jgi:hypothetical protein